MQRYHPVDEDAALSGAAPRLAPDERLAVDTAGTGDKGLSRLVWAPHQAVGEQRVTFDRVLAELRAHDFAVLSTVDEAGEPHAAGVSYGVSPPGVPLALYVMTRRHLRKARSIARNPRVALVVPLPRRLLRFVPPATIQLRGCAEILDWTDPTGTDVFRRFWVGRRILEAYEQARRRGETRVCFLKVTPDREIRTYAVGYGVWDLRRRMESAAGTVRVPPEHRADDTSPGRPAPGGAAPSPLDRSGEAEPSFASAPPDRETPVAGDPDGGSPTNAEEANRCAGD